MTARAKEPTPSPPLVVFGIDNRGKPNGAISERSMPA